MHLYIRLFCHILLSKSIYFSSCLTLQPALRMKEHRRADFERIDKLTAMEAGG